MKEYYLKDAMVVRNRWAATFPESRVGDVFTLDELLEAGYSAATIRTTLLGQETVPAVLKYIGNDEYVLYSI